jgi:hypothetical protein
MSRGPVCGEDQFHLCSRNHVLQAAAQHVAQKVWDFEEISSPASGTSKNELSCPWLKDYINRRDEIPRVKPWACTTRRVVQGTRRATESQATTPAPVGQVTRSGRPSALRRECPATGLWRKLSTTTILLCTVRHIRRAGWCDFRHPKKKEEALRLPLHPNSAEFRGLASHRTSAGEIRCSTLL